VPLPWGPVTGPARDLFLGSYAAVRPLLGAPEAAARWHEPSALSGLSVGGLAGHLVRAGQSVLGYLEDDPPEAAPIDAPDYYASVLAAMDAAAHDAVIERGEAAARAGPIRLLETYDETLARLRRALGREPPDRLVKVFGGLVMRLDDYLATRMVEALVHADDLAVSLGVPPPSPPPGARRAAIDHLVEVALRGRGERAVLVALTRRERDEADALRVFAAVPGEGHRTTGDGSEPGHATR
jgi:uncharacterized protein (TIGR03083 family)